MTVIDTNLPPANARQMKEAFPELLQTAEHHLCPGCGHPPAVRVILEVIRELDLHTNTVCICGHGCSGFFSMAMDIDATIALHGRAPATATGIKRMRPDVTVWTMQGDGDMGSEGLAEILYAAGRGERITCFLMNNGVFGDTGGQMTTATVVGQRTKTSVEGRDVAVHGYPISVPDIIKDFPGVGYVARGSAHNAAGLSQVRKLVRKAFLNQHHGHGLALVEILTMCPTGWFVPAGSGADYLTQSLGANVRLGELKSTD